MRYELNWTFTVEETETNPLLSDERKKILYDQAIEFIEENLDEDWVWSGLLTDINSVGYDGFMPWTDGGIRIICNLSLCSIMSSGVYPSSMETYVRHMEKLSTDYANEQVGEWLDDWTEEKKEEWHEANDDYWSEDDLGLEIAIYYYSGEENGNFNRSDIKGDSLYVCVGLTDEYGKCLHKDLDPVLLEVQKELPVNDRHFEKATKLLLNLVKKGIGGEKK